jgi:hypothetical protein
MFKEDERIILVAGNDALKDVSLQLPCIRITHNSLFNQPQRCLGLVEMGEHSNSPTNSVVYHQLPGNDLWRLWQQFAQVLPYPMGGNTVRFFRLLFGIENADRANDAIVIAKAVVLHKARPSSDDRGETTLNSANHFVRVGRICLVFANADVRHKASWSLWSKDRDAI